MNNRIRELAAQAGGNPNCEAFRGHFLPPPQDHIDPATVDLEKFAELLIRDCIEEIKQYDSWSTGTDKATYIDGFIEGIDRGYKDAVKQIARNLAMRYGVNVQHVE